MSLPCYSPGLQDAARLRAVTTSGTTLRLDVFGHLWSGTKSAHEQDGGVCRGDAVLLVDRVAELERRCRQAEAGMAVTQAIRSSPAARRLRARRSQAALVLRPAA